MEQRELNVINFSGGRTSAYMTKRLIDEGLENYIVTFQNTGKEMPATLDFINECDKRWGLNIVWLEYRYGNNFEVVTYETASRDGRPFDELIAHKKHFLPNQMMRYCTKEMKIETVRRYLQSIGVKEWTSYNGIRYDEPRRWSKAKNLPSYQEIELPLVKWKTTKDDVLNWWSEQDFDLMLKQPYGNCDGCFLKGKGKLAIIAKERPELLDWWINHEEKSGSTFKKEISYKQIKEASQAQQQLFADDPSFECFCNID
jgi:3'-phosphoadenosine 5'-phosphosulfate sulfotransferase (PAPS reductase)/FAD synthetase